MFQRLKCLFGNHILKMSNLGTFAYCPGCLWCSHPGYTFIEMITDRLESISTQTGNNQYRIHKLEEEIKELKEQITLLNARQWKEPELGFFPLPSFDLPPVQPWNNEQRTSGDIK